MDARPATGDAPSVACLGALSLLACAALATTSAAAAEAFPVPARTIQVIAQFDNPEGAIFSADGDAVFISNAGEIGERGESLGWAEGDGYVSKLAVTYDGQLRMIATHLIKDLTGPLGMAVLPVATETFPAGTIVLATGSAPMVDSEGNPLTEPDSLQTKLLFFSEEGDVLGEIATGNGSVFHDVNGAPVALLNALDIDDAGNIYFADTGFGAGQFEPAFEPKGGVWMIPHGSIDALADGEEPAEPPVFLAVPGNPDGVEVSPRDGMVYVNTVGPVAGAPDPANGGVYALEREHIESGSLPEPVDTDLGALDGLDFTAGGLMLNTQIKGDVEPALYVHCPGGAAQTLRTLGMDDTLSGPADIAVQRIANGAHLLVIPELTARDATPGDDEVTVMVLPPDFEDGCAG